MLSTLLNLALAFNMYNTFLVHVVALGNFVELPANGHSSTQSRSTGACIPPREPRSKRQRHLIRVRCRKDWS